MPCPICKRIMCDHSPTQRRQDARTMMAIYYSDVSAMEGVTPVVKKKKVRRKKTGMKVKR